MLWNYTKATFSKRFCRRKIKYSPICRCSPPENWLHPYDENTPETNKGARKQSNKRLPLLVQVRDKREETHFAALCRKKTKRLWFSNARVSQTPIATGQANGYLSSLSQSSQRSPTGISLSVHACHVNISVFDAPSRFPTVAGTVLTI